MNNLLQEYQKFIDSFKGIEPNEIELRASKRPDSSLDYVDVFLEGTEDSILLSPNESHRDNYAEQIFYEASENSVITPENIFKKVLPAFSGFIPKTLIERANPHYKLKPSFLDSDEKDFSNPEVVLSMKAVEEGKNLRLDYSWGL